MLQSLQLAAGSNPSFGSGPSSGPTFGGGAFGAGSSAPGQAPAPFQPAPFSAAGFGQQQPQPASTGFGATNTAGMLCKCSLRRLRSFGVAWFWLHTLALMGGHHAAYTEELNLCVYHATTQIVCVYAVQATWALEQAQASGNSKIRYHGLCSFHHAFVMSLSLLRICHRSTLKFILLMLLVQP